MSPAWQGSSRRIRQSPRPSQTRILDTQHRYSHESRNPGGGAATQMAPKRLQQPAPFSNLGVPADAGTSDCNESMSRITFRDRRINQRREHLCPSSCCRTANRLPLCRPKNVARGLVPRLGGEQPAHTTIPRPSQTRILDTQHRYSHESRNPGSGAATQMAPKRLQQPAPFSNLGVPAPAGMDDCNESTSRITFRDRRINPRREHLCPSSFCRQVARGLVPRLGGGQPAHTTIRRSSHPKILDTQHT